MYDVYRCQMDLLQYEYVRSEREPTNESRRLVGVGGGQMWLASQAEGSVWLALQVEGVGEPPTSRNDSLGVNVAGQCRILEDLMV